jgi:hypothetical protein
VKENIEFQEYFICENQNLKLIKYSTDMCHSCQGTMVILDCNTGETSAGFIAAHHMLNKTKGR